jgi:hypothetical protein
VDALSSGQLQALRNLAAKRSGNVTAFLRIADAQHLTELGLASRSRQGWDITSAGSAYLTRLDAGANDGGQSS